MYRRREGGRMAILGDYLYWDGGKVSRCKNNKCPSTGDHSAALNGTLSIPLNTDWTNSTVSFKESKYPNDMPRSSWFSLWPDGKSGTMHRWGGERVNLKGNTSVEEGDQTPMWMFKADNNGGGEWSIQKPTDGDKFQDELDRNFNGAGAVCGGKGYYLGGSVTAKSNYDPNSAGNSKSYSIPSGLLKYDLSDHKWEGNISSTAGFPELGKAKWGQAVCLEDFAKKPLVMFLGGATTTNDKTWTEVDFNSVALFDPSTDKWHRQNTTAMLGSVPQPRYHFCSVGARGKNNTYDIFLYGGRQGSDPYAAYGDVWILSLPGFVWTSVTNSNKGAPRWSHQCAVAAKSQMISMGGISGWKANTWKDDPWTRTLGVYDMVDLSWKSGYNASAGDYDTPQAFKTWYQQGGEAQWSSDELKALFATGNSSPNPNSNNTTEETAGSGGPNIPAIVGGAVGGLIFLALAAAAVWFLLSRRSKSHNHSRLTEISNSHGGYNTSGYELGSSTMSTPSSAMLSGKPRDSRLELDGVTLRAPSSRRFSLPSPWTWSWVPSVRPKIASPAFPPSPAELNGL
ncbi:unnamed protein product [Clonostachys rosea f. rosea IK726]|uniref:Uncharacterized protein n=1 Tax=Clonostachys rosea f. rosea IK726 TaxID=1349383 RepID=A0ACA9U7Y3_BIOOC|nr:unnamed protein product [Clonostachys rosea f. rosea IK726]